MNIAFVDYSLATRSLDIYISGCNGVCSGCHNPELFNYNIGEKYTKAFFEKKIKNKAIVFKGLVKNIMIFGGEPLDQDRKELEYLLKDLKILQLPIWLFTRYAISTIPKDIKNKCSFIKTGKYNKKLKVDDNIQFGISLASSNQKIHKIG